MMKINGPILMPPMGTYVCDEHGYVTQANLDYYQARAKNKHVSCIIMEHAYISNVGQAKKNQMSIADDGCIEGLTKLVSVIHAENTPVIAQLNHAGSAGIHPEAIAPSCVELPVIPPLGNGTLPKEMTQEDINQVIKEFVAAALRAQKAGFDGVEIHCAHGYLLNQFYSPCTNKRTDAYGQDRLILLLQVIRAVRKAVGSDYFISVRFGGVDDREGGNTIEDAVASAKRLNQEEIQLFDVSGGMCRFTRKGHTEPGYFKDLSKAIKDVVDLPVVLTGGVTTLAQAQALLDEGVADYIGVGRALLANANWMEEV